MIQLTERAAEHIQHMLNLRGHGVGLRLSTRKSGCSGLAYEVDYAEKIDDEDTVFESFNLKIVVDNDSLPNINGTEVDYLKTSAINQGFEFHNPNVQDVCGCGESFNIEPLNDIGGADIGRNDINREET